MATKRKMSSHRCSATAKRPAKANPEQHYLYLVLDDWDKGYSVRKVDVHSDDFHSDDDDDEPEPFTEPPVARFDVVHGNSHCFVTHGTKIVALKPHEVSPAIPAFDAATSAVAILPWPEFRMTFGMPIVISIAGKLLILIDYIHCLGDPPPPPPPRNAFVDARPVQKPWTWTVLSPRARVPYINGRAFSYAVHPDGRTLVVSSVKWHHESGKGTFSFDTDRHEWTRHGDWQLPFVAQAHYVAELDAWVGICRHKGGRGHLCSSDVVPVAAGPTTLPRWKLLGERLFDRESPLHMAATLVHMGRNSFCVVESTWHEGDQDVLRRKAEEGGLYVPPPRVVLRITTFRVEYDGDGELRLASRRTRRRNVFKRAHEMPDGLNGTAAFWI